MKIENIEIATKLIEKKKQIEDAILIHKRMIEKKMPIFYSEDYGTHSYYMLRSWNKNTVTFIGEEQEKMFAKKVFEMAVKELEIELKAIINRIENLD